MKVEHTESRNIPWSTGVVAEAPRAERPRDLCIPSPYMASSVISPKKIDPQAITTLEYAKGFTKDLVLRAKISMIIKRL